MQYEYPEVSVVYLSWIPYGVELFERFASSYTKYRPCVNHKLILLFNGLNHIDDVIPFYAIARQFDLTFESFYRKNGQDIEAYFWLAEQLNASHLLFLNSHSVLLDTNWLQKLTRHFENPKVGVVAPSGSYQSYYSTVFIENSWKWEYKKSVKENYLKYKLLLKAFFYWRFLFPSFPNPHIRTSAFLIRREIFVKLTRKKIKNKFMAYRFESGFRSITRQIIQRGYEALVIDKNGEALKITEWNKVNIFWRGNQEQLLIGDKQSELYMKSQDKIKNKLTELAWGKHQ